MEVVEGVVRVGEGGDGGVGDAGGGDGDGGDGDIGVDDGGTDDGTGRADDGTGRAGEEDAPPRFPDVDAFVAELGRAGEEHGAAVQAFDARLVVDRAHLESAVAHADRAFERGENVARDRAVEILLYAAGRRQINRALAMGVEAGATPAVVVVHGGDEAAAGGGEAVSVGDETKSDEAAATTAVADLLEPTDTLGVAADAAAIREFFDVSDAELAATEADLSALVRERVALLDVEK